MAGRGPERPSDSVAGSDSRSFPSSRRGWLPWRQSGEATARGLEELEGLRRDLVTATRTPGPGDAWGLSGENASFARGEIGEKGGRLPKLAQRIGAAGGIAGLNEEKLALEGERVKGRPGGAGKTGSCWPSSGEVSRLEQKKDGRGPGRKTAAGQAVGDL